MLRKHFANKADEGGFTLVELLVVILIISVLAAIAIPAFLNQRQRANDAAVESDVRNVATNIETLLVADPNAATFRIEAVTGGGEREFTVSVGDETTNVTLSEGVTIEVEAGTAAGTYIVRGAHSNGADYTDVETAGEHLVYDSAAGGLTN